MRLEKPVAEPRSTVLQRVEGQLECEQKWAHIYETEVRAMKRQLEEQSGCEKMLELAQRADDLERGNDELSKKAKSMDAEIKARAKVLEQKGSEQIRALMQAEEEGLFRLLGGERERIKIGQRKLQQEGKNAAKRQEQTEDLETRVAEMERELATMKAAAQARAKAKPKLCPADGLTKEELATRIASTNEEISASAKAHDIEKSALDAKIADLKASLIELNKVH